MFFLFRSPFSAINNALLFSGVKLGQISRAQKFLNVLIRTLFISYSYFYLTMTLAILKDNLDLYWISYSLVPAMILILYHHFWFNRKRIVQLINSIVDLIESLD